MRQGKTSAKPTATLTPPASRAIEPGEGLPSFAVRVRSLFGDCVLTVQAATADEARQRVIDGFAAGVTAEGA